MNKKYDLVGIINLIQFSLKILRSNVLRLFIRIVCNQFISSNKIRKIFAELYSHVTSKETPMRVYQTCPTAEPQANPECPAAFPGKHPLSAVPPYGCRLLEIQRRCKERNMESGSLRSDRFKYGENMPLVFCELPKVNINK